MSEKRIVEIGMPGHIEKVTLDANDLNFNDATLGPFLERASGRIDYIGRCHADSSKYASQWEQIVEKFYIDKFKEFKEEGKSDKTAELYAKGDAKVQQAKTHHIEAKHARDQLYAHLKALNDAREDAHQRGHFLRKEMEKLSQDIYYPVGTQPDYDPKDIIG